MTSWTVRHPLAWIAAAAAVPALVAAVLVVAPPAPAREAAAEEACPPGYRLVDLAEVMAERVLGSDEGEGPQTKTAEQMLAPQCLNNKAPEMFAELATRERQRLSAAAAPFDQVPPGAFRAALNQRNAMAQVEPTVEGADGVWTPYGRGPLLANDPRFDSVNGLGLAELMGRIDSFAYDEAHGRLFATVGTGGVWMSENLAGSWTSIGDTLPTQIIGAIGHTPAGGDDGTLIVISGEPLMGGNTYTGLGGFYSNDLGASWQQAEGLPDQAMGFKVEVDPLDANVVYAATSMGLFRSTDAGHTFTNVALPTSEECAGVVGYGPCQFANFVTDVVIKTPGGVPDAEGDVPAGTVVAAVGYRAGMTKFPDGTVHAPGNGIYRSETGEVGSFEKLDVSGDGISPNGFTTQERIGRTELGIATGPEQDHDFLYAIVEDAILFNRGAPAIDAPEQQGTSTGIFINNTNLNGVYVSDDFGASWIRMADDVEIAENPATNSALQPTIISSLFAPGIQAWYNEWIQVDPTRATDDGVPTRILFGLEEVWQNRNTDAPQDGTFQDERGDFKVIGRYFADEACLFLSTGQPRCPTAEGLTNPATTTHPDHHDAIFVPDGDGGVNVVTGHDGGANVQHVAADEEFDNDEWGLGDQDGFNTLLPYHARIANDGTVWFGLQDNGSAKIEPDTRKRFMTFGGDGFFVAVDKDNSDYAWSETTFASMRYTTDGGRDWTGCRPPVSGAMFNNPFVMDPQDANHLLTAGRQVAETLAGPETCEGDDNRWTTVFDLGTRDNPGERPGTTGDGSPSNQMSAVDVEGDAGYVGYCGVCDILGNTDVGFANGIATNVGGDEPPEKGTSKGWHAIPRPEGLPNRYITAIKSDPANPETVYVTLGGYANREWVPPGSYLDPNEELGEGHVFKSTDAGRTFTDVSGDLPNVHATWVELRPGTDQLVVGTEMGIFVSSDSQGSDWDVLGSGLPLAPVTALQFKPDDPNTLIASTFGRGVYSYDFSGALPNRACDESVVPDPGFDDINGNLHEQNIDCIAWYLITQGKGDVDGDGRDEYVPGQSVPRDQMASFIAHLATDAGIELPADPPDAFRDDGRSAHERNINSLAAIGLVEGKTAGRYAPNERVSREQMATFIARVQRRAAGTLANNARDAFSDDNDSVHQDNINLLAALGIVNGVGGGRFDPSGSVGRDQMATFISNELRLLLAVDKAFFGGADVSLDTTTPGEGGKLTGTVTANKEFVSLTAAGCGLDDEPVEVDEQGAFTVTVPEGQTENCDLTLTAATTNRDAGAETQRITYGFAINVE